MASSKILYVNRIKHLIDSTDSNILVLGKRGYGKTTVLNEVKNHSNDEKLIVDGTLQIGEYKFLIEDDAYNLYYTCLIINKILLHIRMNHANKYIAFVKIKANIDSIFEQINYMNMIGDTKRIYQVVGEDLCKNPEMLIDELIMLIKRNIDKKDITLIVDCFDEIRSSCSRYQNFLYNRIKEYMNLILTVSDESVIDNKVLLEQFNEENRLIKLDYSTNPFSAREILRKELYKKADYYKVHFSSEQDEHILDYETVSLMIEKTDGNLSKMLQSLSAIFPFDDTADINECILDYIDNVINIDPMISGISYPKRTLHIRPKK